MDAMTTEKPTRSKQPLHVQSPVYAPSLAAPVRLLNAGLSERDGEIIAHGWLDLASLDQLRVDDYQREVLSKVGGKKTSIQNAIEDGVRLPDIMLGMRGEHFTSKGTTISLEDPVYIIDGLQRVFGMKQFAEVSPEAAKTRLIGAEVRFGTDKESEKDLFLVLNTSRIPVSGNVILRNQRDDHPSLLTLYGLCHSDKDFPLYGRVQWTQRMARGDLITAVMLSNAAHGLHSFDGRGSMGHASKAGSLLDTRAKDVGLNNFRSNVKTFFQTIDACWPFGHVEYRETAIHTKGNFLLAMARLMAMHDNFWKGDKLFVDAPQKRKLAAFPVNDPEVLRLASSGTMAMPILLGLIVEHFNKGKRVVGRLHKRTDNE